MTPEDHKRARYHGRVKMAGVGLDLTNKMATREISLEAIESYVDGLGDSFLDLTLACLSGAGAYALLQRLADEASRHIPEAAHEP